ncbi:MAG: aldo/keto reductase [Ancalomicrobiaceae bacterium]|nr:aldo/keto reductase [Ancalomicrobiaceae bacterium]
MESKELRPGYTISRVIRGGWQLAGGHGAIDRERAVDDLMAAFDAGITTFDCADIYTGVEDLYGALRSRLREERGAEAAANLKVHTKLVPDLDVLPKISKAHIAGIVDQSLGRLKIERLDVVQFHWWDYQIPGALQSMLWLDDLRREGKIRFVSGTNFDTPHVRAIVQSGVPLMSLQVQYSLIDRRPENGLSLLAAENGVHLFCYGSVAGGYLSDRWLGQREPTGEQENRSLTKYKLIIDDFGGWAPFQHLLEVLRRIADRHSTDIATVASRFVLDLPNVAAVIVGARNRAHVAENAAISALRLTDADKAAIAAVTSKATGPAGDVYALERDRTGKHGAIMKYNLNAEAH